MTNIVLIGMPGAGKSTVGVILAKALRKKFVDTDLVLQETTGRHLQEILDDNGPEVFRKLEEETVLSHTFRNTVIATGGSVVLSAKAMKHLRAGGVVVYLEIPFREIGKRFKNITTRGIVTEKGQTLREIYNGRVPLYEKYADITVNCSGHAFERVVATILEQVRRLMGDGKKKNGGCPPDPG